MNSQLPPGVMPLGTDQIDFVELSRTLSRLKWRILGVAGVFMVIGVLAAFTATPIYRGSVTLLLEARPNRAVQVGEVYDPGYQTDEYFETQTQLIRSRELIGRVVDQMHLADVPEILPSGPSPLQTLLSGSWLPFVPDAPVPASADLAQIRREQAIDAVLSRIEVGDIYRTQLRQIHFESADPQLAANVANAIGDGYINSGIESHMEATERATKWLNERLADLRTKLEASEEALQKYREAHQLVNVGGTRSLYEEDVVDNARKLRDAQRKKTELASTYWKIQQAGTDDSKLQDVSSLQLDPTVQKAGDNLLQATQAVKQLEERYGAKHPQMAAAQARLAGAQASYYNQLRLAANGVKAEYEIAAETERALTGIVQSGKAQIQKLDERDYEVQSLEHEVQTNRELFDMFLKRYKETDTASTFEALSARLVDRAVVPTKPFKPNKPRTIVLWTLAGLLIGVILGALRHLLAENIRSPDQLEQATGLPVLTVLPPVPGMGRKVSAPSLVMQQPRAPFPEGVRSIRASLHLSDVDKRMKRVMITSAVPREGKSSIASGFAAVLGHSEHVILVEADLRAPNLKSVFGIPKDAPGLVEVLTGQAKLEQAVFVHAESGAHVLPVAQIPANPSEVIGSAAFAKLLDVLGTRYDRVILDTPPCQVASDSLLLAHKMDAVLFVVHGAATGLRTIQAAIKHLRSAQAPLLGHVLNQVDARKAFGYDGSYYVYGQYGHYGEQ